MSVDFVRYVPDFPREGIVFKHLTPRLAEARALIVLRGPAQDGYFRGLSFAPLK